MANNCKKQNFLIRLLAICFALLIMLAPSSAEAGPDTLSYPGLSSGEGTVRPDGADIMATKDRIVAVVKVASNDSYEPYLYTFMATPDGASGVVVQGHMDLPQPRIDKDVCPLHTFLKVADSKAIVPPPLITSCADGLKLFGRGVVDFRARDIRVDELRDDRSGNVTYVSTTSAPYCSGGDGGRSAFINQRCSDIDSRVNNTTSTYGIGWGQCAIYTDNDGTLNKKARCDSHVTGGWLQLTSSLSIFPNSGFAGFTTKTRWQVAACVQPLEIKWKQRFHTTQSFPANWYHFTNVQPNNWAVMTLYAGTASTDYLCTGGNCWTTRDFRVAIDQEPGDGRFRAANGWVAMQGKATSQQCNLAL